MSASARSSIPLQNKYDRVILLVDMDCFYCQVEEKLNPQLKGQPLAVVQYNAWRGGGIIAVNYAARAKGVTRHIRGEEAKELCPEIQLVKVPNVREKADLSKYRDAGKEVANVLQRFTPLLERASVDEAYLDITEAVNKRLEQMNAGTFVLQSHELVNTFAVGHAHIGEYVTTITTRFANPYASQADDGDDHFQHDTSDAVAAAVRQSDIRLLLGASIASEVRAAVKAETSYECSAGIAHNKIIAKLACGMNKPNKQTILPLAQIPPLFETLPVRKITGLGGKYGEEVCESFNVRFLGQMLKFSETELQRKFDEKNGSWLYNICRGIDLEVVTPRFYSKSIGCCKNFPGRNRITGLKTLCHWFNELAEEICDRLAKDEAENNRRAKQMVVNYVQEFDAVGGTKDISSSRSAPLGNYDRETLAKHSFDVLKANTKQFLRNGSETVLNNPIKFLGISVGKFEAISSGRNTLQAMFAQQEARRQQRRSDGDAEGKQEGDENKNEIEEPKGVTLREKETIKNYFQLCREETTIESNCQNKTKELRDDRESGENRNAIDEVQEHVAKTKTIKSFFVNYLQSKKEKNIDCQAKTEIDQKEQNVSLLIEPKSVLIGEENTLKVIKESEHIVRDEANVLSMLKDHKAEELQQENEQFEIKENYTRSANNETNGECENKESQQAKPPQVKSFFLNVLNKRNEIAIEKNTRGLNIERQSFFTHESMQEVLNDKRNIDHENSDCEKIDHVNDRMSTISNREDTSNFFEVTKSSNQIKFQNDDNLLNLEADLEIVENEMTQEHENTDNELNRNVKPKEQRSFFAGRTELAKEVAISGAVEKQEVEVPTVPTKKRKFNDIATTVAVTNSEVSTVNSLDYQANYAEYAIPDLHTGFQLDLIKCDECGVKIPAGDERTLQTHHDHHYAQQLSQQQRVEYRVELKNKIVGGASKSPVQKKPKKSPAAGTKSVITKFLKPVTNTEPSTSQQAAAIVAASIDLEVCTTCKQLVCKTKMAEHHDYHVAKDLQRKLNQLEVRTVPIVKKSNVSSGSSSSANKSLNSSLPLNGTQRSGSVVSKPITQYFSQPHF